MSEVTKRAYGRPADGGTEKGLLCRWRRETRTKERGERAGELRFVMERKNSRAALVGTRLSRSPPKRERGPVSVSRHRRCLSRH